MITAEGVVLALGAYLGIGAIIGILFLVFAAAKLDDAVKDASVFFRLMIFPGCVAVWPYIVLRWLSGRRINRQIEEEA